MSGNWHRVPHVEQELVTFPENLSSLRYSVGFGLLDLQFSVWCFLNRCLSFYFFLSLFVIQNSDYFFCIFQLFSFFTQSLILKLTLAFAMIYYKVQISTCGTCHCLLNTFGRRYLLCYVILCKPTWRSAYIINNNNNVVQTL